MKNCKLDNKFLYSFLKGFIIFVAGRFLMAKQCWTLHQTFMHCICYTGLWKEWGEGAVERDRWSRKLKYLIGNDETIILNDNARLALHTLPN